jgi:predicted AlkP superfamily phosphohydrolase/phosphomutase
MSKKENKKLVVIGIDGGTFNLINPMFEKGKLPNLKKIKNSGVLRSTIPPGTSVAWSSFATGNGPGKTNVYDFTIVDDNSWKIKFINKKIIGSKTLWKYLNEAGLKSCVINVPVTYPPEEINGVMISGIDTPSTLSNYTHPKEIKEKLKEFNYQIDVSALKDKKDLPEQAIEILRSRIKTARHFLYQDFDFFMVMFRATDIIQHFAWKEEINERAYELVDEFIGEAQKYLEKAGGKIIAMSDHGFEKVDKALNLNVWLEREGYLTTNIKSSWMSSVGINRERIFKILEKMKLNFLVKAVPRTIGKKIPTKAFDFEEAILTKVIDFEKTKAVSKRCGKASQIFLNKECRGGIVKKEDEENLKKELIEKIKKFFKGQNIEIEIWTKEELYGKETSYSPDVTLYVKSEGYDTISLFDSKKNLWGEGKEPATHNLEGVIFSDITLKMDSAEIIDLTPTILNYFGIKGGKFEGKSLI